MSRLVYTAIASLDGFTADESGSFAWAFPSEEVHAFVNELERPAGSYLYGRRLYEVMAGWQTMGLDAADPAVVVDYAELWRAARKLVFSRTLAQASTPRTELIRAFDPARIHALKEAEEDEMSVGGATLAAAALRAGLVDELRLFTVPYLAGGGLAVLPAGLRAELRLLEQRGFGNGTVYARYAIQ